MSHTKEHDTHEHLKDGRKATIKIVPDKSTQEAMKSFDVKSFNKKLSNDAKIISSHKIKF